MVSSVDDVSTFGSQQLEQHPVPYMVHRARATISPGRASLELHKMSSHKRAREDE